MSVIRYNFLFVIGMLAILGLNSVTARAADDKNKRPKNTGILSVKTSPQSYQVKVDGQIVGMSGTVDAAEFYLAPGLHTVEVAGPAGTAPFTKQIDVKKDTRNCICLKTIEHTNKRPCPYDVRVDGPENVLENDLITFAAFNSATASAVPLNYLWRVSPDTAKITSGLGTPSITVDTTGLGGQTVTAELDVSDGSPNDAKCRQLNSVKTTIGKPPVIVSRKFDEFEARTFDDDKARLDNLAIELQNSPDTQAYIILYQGTDKNSLRLRNADKLSQHAVDYLVKTRGVDPRRIVVTKWGSRPQTMYEIWIIPPGAQPPVPQS